jgi:hypothetical protein
MGFSKLSRTCRLFLGVLAAGLGLGATATQVVQVAAEPATGDSSDSLNPASLPAPGTYESCSGLFGLYKWNSDLVSFDIVQGANPVATLPVMGTDIVPIVTLSDGTTSVSCEAVPGWADEAGFSNYLNETYVLVGTSMAYPGVGYFLVPAIYGFGFSVNGGSFVPTIRSIEYFTNLDLDETLSADPGQLVALASDYAPHASWPSSSSELTDPFFTRVYSAILNSPTGSQAQVDYLNQQLSLDTDNQPMTCSDQDPILIALIATMQSLWTDFDPRVVASNCSGLMNGTLAIGRIELFNAEVSDTEITLMVSGPAPSTTTTSTTVSATPVVPVFAG